MVPVTVIILHAFHSFIVCIWIWNESLCRNIFGISVTLSFRAFVPLPDFSVRVCGRGDIAFALQCSDLITFNVGICSALNYSWHILIIQPVYEIRYELFMIFHNIFHSFIMYFDLVGLVAQRFFRITQE